MTSPLNLPSPRQVERSVKRTRFRPDIEGLRAVAVIAVVLYHADIPGVAGGYIGVDVFFVISGFLITGLLWREVTTANTIGLGRFYGARARRLLPAAATVGIATAVGAAVVLPPLQARRDFVDGVASALYVGNYRFAMQGTDYLASDLPPSPFQHYWSLGVEEQFYLVWPMLIIGTAWLVGRLPILSRRAPSAASLATPYALVLALVAAVSLAAGVLWTHTSPSWAFFSLPTRAWELAAGGLVAMSIRQWRRLPLLPAAIVGWGGLALIVLTCTQLGPHTPYPGTAAGLPVLGTALVIGGGCVTGSLGAGRALCRPAMRAIGRISYSWYLWHWPVLLLMPPLLGVPAGLPVRLTAIVVSAGLAVITLHLVENPGRFAAGLRRSAKASLAVAGAASAVTAGACLLLLTVIPVPAGHGRAAPKANIVALPPTAAPDLSPQEAAVRQAFAQARDAVAASADLRAIPSNLEPSLANAPADKAAVFVNGCTRSWRDVGQAECAGGDTASPTTVALVGDSHAAMWNPAFQQVAAQRHWRLETLAKVTCPLQELHIASPYLGREYTECEQWRGQIMARLQAEHPRLVVLSMSRRYGADFGFTSYDPAWIDTLGRTVTQLRNNGSTVLVLGPVADPRSSVPACLSGHLDDATACAPPRLVAVNADGIAAEQTAATGAGGHYADLSDLFCTPNRCPMIVGNTLVFRDDNHVTTEYAQLLAPLMGALADRAVANG
jgi:peptidoglycan/LPS O-acetylase OafA/YrhL